MKSSVPRRPIFRINSRKQFVFLVVFNFHLFLASFGMDVHTNPRILLEPPDHPTHQLIKATQDQVGQQAIKMGRQAEDASSKGRTYQAMSGHMKEEDRASTFTIGAQYHHIQFSELNNQEQLNSVCFNGQYGNDHVLQLRRLKSMVEGIDKAKKSWQDVYLKSYGSQEKFDESRAQTEYLSDVIRGILADAYDKRSTNREEYEWCQRKLYDIMNEPGTQSNLLGSIKADRSLDPGSHQLGHPLRRIRVCLRNRSATTQERVLLDLGRVEEAGFTFSREVISLAEKIAGLAQRIVDPAHTVLLSSAEKKLLKNLEKHTLSVRRQDHLLRIGDTFDRLQKQDALGLTDPDDSELIFEALNELHSKEIHSRFWTDEDEKLAKALTMISREHGTIEQIVADIRHQKAYKVLRGKRAATLNLEDVQLLRKLSKNIQNYPKPYQQHHRVDDLTEEETIRVRKLAKQYYWMKVKFWEPKSYDPIGAAIKAMENEVSSLEELSIRFLRTRETLDSSQEILLRKLERGIPSIRLQEDTATQTERGVYENEMRLSDDKKIKRVKKALESPADQRLIGRYTEADLARLFEETVYSTPLSEYWIWGNQKHKSSIVYPELHSLLSIAESGVLTFDERCKAVIYSTKMKEEMYWEERPPVTVESLALQRLKFLHSQNMRILDAHENLVYAGLDGELFGEIWDLNSKQKIKSLALEELLVQACKATVEDQKLALKVQSGPTVSLSELTPSEWTTIFHLLPDEIVSLGRLCSAPTPEDPTIFGKDTHHKLSPDYQLENDYPSFFKNDPFSQILVLIQKASDRMNLQAEETLLEVNNPAEFLMALESNQEASNLDKYRTYASKIQELHRKLKNKVAGTKISEMGRTV